MMTLKKCRVCSASENLSIHGRYPRKDGTFNTIYTCNPCNTERLKNYRATREGALAAQRAVAKYEQANKNRRSAWNKAQAKYKRPEPCVVCSSELVDRHHPDPDKPFEIVFLCRKHHKDAHRVEKALLSKALVV